MALMLGDHINNFVESSNNVIVKHKDKPAYSTLEEIRRIATSMFERCFNWQQVERVK